MSSLPLWMKSLPRWRRLLSLRARVAVVVIFLAFVLLTATRTRLFPSRLRKPAMSQRLHGFSVAKTGAKQHTHDSARRPMKGAADRSANPPLDQPPRHLRERLVFDTQSDASAAAPKNIERVVLPQIWRVSYIGNFTVREVGTAGLDEGEAIGRLPGDGPVAAARRMDITRERPPLRDEAAATSPSTRRLRRVAGSKMAAAAAHQRPLTHAVTMEDLVAALVSVVPHAAASVDSDWQHRGGGAELTMLLPVPQRSRREDASVKAATTRAGGGLTTFHPQVSFDKSLQRALDSLAAPPSEEPLGAAAASPSSPLRPLAFGLGDPEVVRVNHQTWDSILRLKSEEQRPWVDEEVASAAHGSSVTDMPRRRLSAKERGAPPSAELWLASSPRQWLRCAIAVAAHWRRKYPDAPSRNPKVVDIYLLLDEPGQEQGTRRARLERRDERTGENEYAACGDVLLPTSLDDALAHGRAALVDVALDVSDAGAAKPRARQKVGRRRPLREPHRVLLRHWWLDAAAAVEALITNARMANEPTTVASDGVASGGRLTPSSEWDRAEAAGAEHCVEFSKAVGGSPTRFPRSPPPAAVLLSLLELRSGGPAAVGPPTKVATAFYPSTLKQLSPHEHPPYQGMSNEVAECVSGQSSSAPSAVRMRAASGGVRLVDRTRLGAEWLRWARHGRIRRVTGTVLTAEGADDDDDDDVRRANDDGAADDTERCGVLTDRAGACSAQGALRGALGSADECDGLIQTLAEHSVNRTAVGMTERQTRGAAGDEDVRTQHVWFRGLVPPTKAAAVLDALLLRSVGGFQVVAGRSRSAIAALPLWCSSWQEHRTNSHAVDTPIGHDDAPVAGRPCNVTAWLGLTSKDADESLSSGGVLWIGAHLNVEQPSLEYDFPAVPPSFSASVRWHPQVEGGRDPAAGMARRPGGPSPSAVAVAFLPRTFFADARSARRLLRLELTRMGSRPSSRGHFAPSRSSATHPPPPPQLKWTFAQSAAVDLPTAAGSRWLGQLLDWLEGAVVVHRGNVSSYLRRRLALPPTNAGDILATTAAAALRQRWIAVGQSHHVGVMPLGDVATTLGACGMAEAAARDRPSFRRRVLLVLTPPELGQRDHDRLERAWLSCGGHEASMALLWHRPADDSQQWAPVGQAPGLRAEDAASIAAAIAEAVPRSAVKEATAAGLRDYGSLMARRSRLDAKDAAELAIEIALAMRGVHHASDATQRNDDHTNTAPLNGGVTASLVANGSDTNYPTKPHVQAASVDESPGGCEWSRLATRTPYDPDFTMLRCQGGGGATESSPIRSQSGGDAPRGAPVVVVSFAVRHYRPPPPTSVEVVAQDGGAPLHAPPPVAAVLSRSRRYFLDVGVFVAASGGKGGLMAVRAVREWLSRTLVLPGDVGAADRLNDALRDEVALIEQALARGSALEGYEAGEDDGGPPDAFAPRMLKRKRSAIRKLKRLVLAGLLTALQPNVSRHKVRWGYREENTDRFVDIGRLVVFGRGTAAGPIQKRFEQPAPVDAVDNIRTSAILRRDVVALVRWFESVSSAGLGKGGPPAAADGADNGGVEPTDIDEAKNSGDASSDANSRGVPWHSTTTMRGEALVASLLGPAAVAPSSAFAPPNKRDSAAGRHTPWYVDYAPYLPAAAAPPGSCDMVSDASLTTTTPPPEKGGTPPHPGRCCSTWVGATTPISAAPDAATTSPPAFVVIHYPWVLDNIYHTHNDNIFPLLLAVAQVMDLVAASRTPSASPPPANRSVGVHLVLLPTRRFDVPPGAGKFDIYGAPVVRKAALPAFHHVAQRFFDSITTLASAPVSFAEDGASAKPDSQRDALGRPTATQICVDTSRNHVVWGRPRRVFAAELDAVWLYAEHRVVDLLRFGLSHPPSSSKGDLGEGAIRGGPWGRRDQTKPRRPFAEEGVGRQQTPRHSAAGAADPPPLSVLPVRVTYIHRKGTRQLLNSAAFTAALFYRRNVTLRLCCDGLTYPEQLRLMRDTDILIAIHGAGLLHIVHLGEPPSASHGPPSGMRPSPLAVHVASRRLNYHEQTVIERLALLSHPVTGVRYLVTRTRTPPLDPVAKWQESFWLPAAELVGIIDHALHRYWEG